MVVLKNYGFRLKLAAALALVALADWLFWQQELIATGIGWLALAWVTAVVLAVPAVRKDRRALLSAACAGGFALIHLWDPSLLSWCLFWGALMMTVLLPRADRFHDAFFWLQQQFWTALTAAFGPVIDVKRAMTIPAADLPGTLRRTLPMVILPLMGGAIFITLFASANPVVDKLFADVQLPTINGERVLLWAFLLTIGWSALRPRRIKRALIAPLGELALLSRIPPASIILSLVVFNVIFAAQNLLDIVILWGGEGLPSGMSYADYAHRGAYPLIVTALLAGVFVITLLRPGSEAAKRPVIRWLVLAWVVQNVFLVASAMLRLELYVAEYQLTPLRLAAFVWMLLVALGLALICWRVLAGKSAAWLVNSNAAAALAVLTAGSIADLSAATAWYNIDHSLEVGGTGASLDLCYLEEQRDSALLALISLEARDLPPLLHERVTSVRRRVLSNAEHEQRHADSWTWRREQRLNKALVLIADLPKHEVSYRTVSCAGGEMITPEIEAAIEQPELVNDEVSAVVPPPPPPAPAGRPSE